jgi:hypothetical protein
MSDAPIGYETLRRLEGPYHTVASMRDFPALSRFEQWVRFLECLAETPGTIGPREFAALDALNIAQKSQLLDWLESPRERAALKRYVG